MTPDASRNGHIRSALRHLFNDEIAASRDLLQEYIISAPHDPVGYAMSAAVPFYHLVTTNMRTQHGNSIRRIILGKSLPMSSAMQHELSHYLQKAQALSLKHLAANPRDENAEFALCVSEGVSRDIMALVFKRWLLSFRHAKAATEHSTNLLALNPDAYDAYFVIGFSEFLIQEVPVIFRPFAEIPGIVGDTHRAIEFLEAAASRGDYFCELARQTLVTIYADQGRYADALSTMQKLSQTYPNNPGYRMELERLRAAAQKNDA